MLPPPPIPELLPSPVPPMAGMTLTRGAPSLSDGMGALGRFRHESRALPVIPAHWGIALAAESMGGGLI